MKNYKKIGKHIETVELAMGKAQSAFSDFETLYLTLQKNYIKKYTQSTDSHIISNCCKEGYDKNLFTLSAMGHYVKGRINIINTNDQRTLMKFFPKSQFIYAFLQMTENKWIKILRYITYLRVKTNKKLYIRPAALEPYFEYKNNYSFKWPTLKKTFNISDLKVHELFYADFFGYQKNSKYSIRIISMLKINIRGLLLRTEQLNDEIRNGLKKIIFHLHGGGFISMSSSSHQVYLRKYAKAVNACIFSIDYPLAPTNRYKVIVKAVFEAYIVVIVKLLVYNTRNFQT